MKITFIFPSMGRTPGTAYIRSWQMEPLAIGCLAALTPESIETVFWDDRLEDIPFDAATDLVAISVETYTAKRAYQIASEYRRRGIPVVMGGFHATLMPQEVLRYAEAVVIGAAEPVWASLVADFQAGTLKRTYQGAIESYGAIAQPDRSIFNGKNYLKLALVETGRGCQHRCDFCAIQQFFSGSRRYRDPDAIVAEIRSLKGTSRYFFFVDDHINANRDAAKALFKALIPLKIKWFSQASITIAQDEEMLDLMRRSGCAGVLIGFESLDTKTLQAMNKGFNRLSSGIPEAIRTIHRHGLKLYATFVFGYDHDTESSFQEAVALCRREKIFIAAFNHLVPFPGTALYTRLEAENRLLYPEWWLDDTFRFGQVPFQSKLPPQTIEQRCLASRQAFYSLPSILQRAISRNNAATPFTLLSYLIANGLLKKEVTQRFGLRLGNTDYPHPLLETETAREPVFAEVRP